MLTVMITVSLLCFIVSELTRNYSQVDKLWSPLPTAYGLVALSYAPSALWINWTATDAVLLVLLFQGSTRFTESISLSKYPGYREYQKKVPALIPWQFRS
jgi:steroid 5-alpha reductase family enzyme